MCVSPIQLNSPSKCIDYRGGQLLRLSVPCGKCYQCQRKKKQEWYVRTLYQVDETFSRRGYVQYVTLTYDNKHLPKISHYLPEHYKSQVKDFSCFDHTHFKLFLKRLRRLIHYYYKLPSNAFGYFLTTEYGTDDRYTHRPHIHIMFFVYAFIHPISFSKLVAQAWTYGMTDGIPYKSLPYVADHTYGYSLGFGTNATLDVLKKVCTYVSKYVNKSSTFQKTLDKRIAYLRTIISDEDELNKLKRSIDMFHRQSQHFGISAIQNLDYKRQQLLLENKLGYLDSDSIYKSISLPTYYKRHLYYSHRKRNTNPFEKNQYYWQLENKEWYSKSLLSNIDNMSKLYSDLYYNASNEDKSHIDMLLNGRNFRDFTTYLLLYRGRLRDHNSFDPQSGSKNYELTDKEYNIYDWIDRILKSTDSNTFNDSDLVIRRDNEIYIRNGQLNNNLFNFVNYAEYHSIPYAEYVSQFTFNENSDIAFKDFDKLYSLLNSISKVIEDKKQAQYEYEQSLKERLKPLKIFNYGKN